MTEEELEALIFHDLFGRELETHKCQYCGEVKPVKVGSGIERCTEVDSVLMTEDKDRKAWTCLECLADINIKSIKP